jgi:N-terminal acetyltransferase B complex catalytic subunit
LGKAEGSPHDFHGHVTALSVAPEYRRLSLARILMNFLETASDDVYGGLFVDLYVRCTNSIAIDLYEGLGYSVYRRVREYYGSLGLGPGGKDEEDAFGSLPLSSQENKIDFLFLTLPAPRLIDMRKPMSRDVQRRSVRPNGRDVIVSAHDVT